MPPTAESPDREVTLKAVSAAKSPPPRLLSSAGMDRRKLDLGFAGMDIKGDTITDIKTAQENQGEEEIGGCVECVWRVDPQWFYSFSDTESL